MDKFYPYKWIEENIQIAFEFAKDTGKPTVSKLSSIFEVGTTTISNWKRKIPEFKEAIDKGKKKFFC